jgi:ATP-dependent DNA helicase RecG
MGIANFKVVDLVRDQHLISQVQQASYDIQKNYPQSATQLIDCWLPDRERYINV